MLWHMVDFEEGDIYYINQENHGWLPKLSSFSNGAVLRKDIADFDKFESHNQIQRFFRIVLEQLRVFT